MTTSGSAETRPDRSRVGLWLALILLATLACYVKTLWNGFTYDDRVYAAAYTDQGPNPMVVGDHELGEYFVRPMGAGVVDRSRSFRPLTVLSYAVTHKLARRRLDARAPPDSSAQTAREWTDPAWPHHLVNLLLHLLATSLVYLLVRVIAGDGRPALLAAAVFGLHAIRSDPVCSIVGRGELLSFVFGAGGLLLYLRALSAAGTRRLLWGLAAAGSTLLATLGKESAITWVVFTPLFAHVQGSAGRTRDLKATLPVALLAAALPALLFGLLYARFLAVAVTEPFEVSYVSNPLFGLGLLERLPTAVFVQGYGLLVTLAPFRPCSDYGWRVFEVVGYTDWRFLVAASAVVGSLVLGLLQRRRDPLVFLAVVTFFGFRFVTSNVAVPIETVFGERHLYTPALGLSFLVAALALRAPRSVLAALSLWLLASAAVCVQRGFHWQSNETLFEVDARRQPRSVALQVNAARLARLRCPPDWARRERLLGAVLELDPASFTVKNELAADLLQHGDPARAEELLRSALADIESAGAAFAEFELREQRETVLLNLAAACGRSGEWAEARRCYERVIEAGAGRSASARSLRARRGAFWAAWRLADERGATRIAEVGRRTWPREPSFALDAPLRQWRAGQWAAAADGIAVRIRALAQSELTLLAWEALIECLERSGQLATAAAASGHHANLLMRLGAFESAARVVAGGLAHAPRSPALRKLHVWLAWEIEDRAAVERRLAVASTVAVGDPELAVHHGLLAADAGDWPAAVATLRRLEELRASPPLLRAWVARARALHRSGDEPGSRSVIQEACRRYPDMPRKYAQGLLRLGKNR